VCICVLHSRYAFKGERDERMSTGCASVTFKEGGKEMSRERVPELGGREAASQGRGGASLAPAKTKVENELHAPAEAAVVEALEKQVQAVHPGERRALGLQQHPPKHDPLAQSKWEEQGSPGEYVRQPPVWNAHPPQPTRTAPGEQQAPSRQAPVLQVALEVQG
jgi:hypothetical protein